MDEDRTFESALGRLPGAAATPDDALRARAADAVRTGLRRRAARRSRQIGIAAAGATLAAVVYLGAASRPGLAAVLRASLLDTARATRLSLNEVTFDPIGRQAARTQTVADFSEAPRIRVERSIADGPVQSLEIWNGMERWTQRDPGAVPVHEVSGALWDLRSELFLGPWLEAVTAAGGQRLVSLGDGVVRGRRARIVALNRDRLHRTLLKIDARDGLLLQRDEEERVGDTWWLRRRLDVWTGPFKRLPRRIFAPPFGAQERQTIGEAVLRDLAASRRTLRDRDRTVTIGSVTRNRAGDLFVLFVDGYPRRAAHPASISVSAAGAGYLGSDWFTLDTDAKKPLTADGAIVQGRWFPSRAKVDLSRPVTLHYGRASLTVRPTRRDQAFPDYGGLISIDLSSPLDYLRPLRRAEDARLAHDPRRLRTAADEALQIWPSLPAPYDGWLRDYALQDKSWALRQLGDIGGAHAALAEAMRVKFVDPNETRPFHRAAGWGR